MKEIWKEIRRFECLYLVSNKGRIEILDTNNKHIVENVVRRVLLIEKKGNKRGTLLKEMIYEEHATGKIFKCVYLGKNSDVLIYVHFLVAQVFFPKNQQYYSALFHKNGNTKDNRVENLCWKYE